MVDRTLRWNNYLVNAMCGSEVDVADDLDGDRLQALGMLASALAGRPVAVVPVGPGEPSWTDGQSVFIDPSAHARANLESIAVHASLIAAGSLDPDVVGALVRHPRLAKRYLAVEGHRALAGNGDLLPGMLISPGRPRCGGPYRFARIVAVHRVGQGRS